MVELNMFRIKILQLRSPEGQLCLSSQTLFFQDSLNDRFVFICRFFIAVIRCLEFFLQWPARRKSYLLNLYGLRTRSFLFNSCT